MFKVRANRRTVLLGVLSGLILFLLLKSASKTIGVLWERRRWRLLADIENNMDDPRPFRPYVYTAEASLLGNVGFEMASDWEGVAYYSRHQMERMGKLDFSNLEEVGLRIRMFGRLKPCSAKTSLFRFLETQLFHWALYKHESVLGWMGAFVRERGIVMTTGDAYAKSAIQAITTLRFHGCRLPIEVFHMGPFDLSNENREALIKLGDVTCRDVCESFDCLALDLQKWDGKPFALLASSFREVILMDADAIFMQNPEVMFDDEDYVLTGSLFFKDRTLFGGSYGISEWLQSILPKPLNPHVVSSRVFRAQSSHEQEAGVVVLDKHRHLLGLLATCLLNIPGGAKEAVREKTHGEKETFWLGLALADESYAFNPGLPGAIGTLQRNRFGNPAKDQICSGHLAHFDRNGKLLWFNDGLTSNKGDPEWALEPAAFTHIGQEGRWTDYMCLRGNITSLPKGMELRLQRIWKLNGFNLNLIT